MYKFKKLVLALGLCGAVATGTAAADMKVGALFPFSGALALLGQESYRGLELAVNEINAAGGINGEKIQIVKADAVDPTQAVSETKRLISSNVIGVFGSYASGISYAASPVTELAGVPYFELGATAHKITTRGYKYLFRSNPNTALYGVSQRPARDHRAGHGAESQGHQDRHHPRGRPLRHRRGRHREEARAGAGLHGGRSAALFRQDGGPVLAHPASEGRQGGRGAANGLPERRHPVLQPGAAGFKPKVVIGAGGGYSLADTAKAVGADMNGVFDLDFPQSSINPAGAPGLDKFLEAYKSTYKSDPQSGHSLTNYVGAKAFFDAIAKAKSTDKDKIRASVLAYKVPAGQTANGWAFDFGEDGQNNASTFYVMQWQDGKLVTIAPSNLALGKPVFNK